MIHCHDNGIFIKNFVNVQLNLVQQQHSTKFIFMFWTILFVSKCIVLQNLFRTLLVGCELYSVCVLIVLF